MEPQPHPDFWPLSLLDIRYGSGSRLRLETQFLKYLEFNWPIFFETQTF